MDRRIRDCVLIVMLGVGGSLPHALAQNPDSLPPGVTPAMVTQGKTLFQGAGLCAACHGPEGKGGLGPDLTDTVWLHHDGGFDALVRQITTGIMLDDSKTGQLMPPRGGGVITDEQIRSVAAYVWSLNRRKQ